MASRKAAQGLRRVATYTFPPEAGSVRPWSRQEVSVTGELWPCLLSSEVDPDSGQALWEGTWERAESPFLHIPKKRRPHETWD